jgi:hypothetical protein
MARLADSLVQRLTDAGVTGGRSLTTRTIDREVWIGTDDQWLLKVVASGDDVVLSVLSEGGTWRDHLARGLADLSSCFPQVAESVRVALDRLSVRRLEKGRRYRIARDFVDFHGNAFAVGEELVFDELHHLPHDDGYTVRFIERTMWLQGDSRAYAEFGLNVTAAGDAAPQ